MLFNFSMVRFKLYFIAADLQYNYFVWSWSMSYGIFILKSLLIRHFQCKDSVLARLRWQVVRILPITIERCNSQSLRKELMKLSSCLLRFVMTLESVGTYIPMNITPSSLALGNGLSSMPYNYHVLCLRNYLTVALRHLLQLSCTCYRNSYSFVFVSRLQFVFLDSKCGTCRQ